MVVDTSKIEAILDGAEEPDERRLSLILKDAERCEGLSLEQCAALLSVKDPRLLERLARCAGRVKQKVFGKRIVLFAPLYLSNYCANACLYCGFRSANKELPRKALSEEEVVREAAALEKMGFKRVLLVTGEDPLRRLDYIMDSVRAIYRDTGIRIVHVNAPPMDVDELRELKKSGVGVYQVFQETYHRPTYAAMHPAGPKSDYGYRLRAMDRAILAGFGDVGIGALLGLYDHRFDALSAIAHSRHLYSRYGTHAHTLSVPRLRPAAGSALIPEDAARHAVSDEEFKKVVAVYRLAVPSAGVVVSTREPVRLRNELIHAGASQLSAASRTDPGGYTADEKTIEQFSTSDRRTLVEVMVSVLEEGGLPSLCTTCYRTGRVGAGFTEITSRGEMQKYCQANALLTLKEYMLDHPAKGGNEIFDEIITKALDDIKEPEIRKKVTKRLKELEKGKRDLYL